MLSLILKSLEIFITKTCALKEEQTLTHAYFLPIATRNPLLVSTSTTKPQYHSFKSNPSYALH